jgi:hypothetical protein
MVPVAHIMGVPVEETAAMFAPVAAVTVGAVAVRLRGRWRELRDGERRDQKARG